MRRVAVLIAVLMMFALSASIAWADTDVQAEKAHRIPEVPIALIYPAIGIASYGIYRLVHRNS